MLTVGELNLSSVLEYTSSFEEVLKKTMIGQELAFRKQVCELHRLYQVQQTLTGDSGCEELDVYNFWTERLQSPVPPSAHPMEYAALAEGKLSRHLAVGSTVSLDQGWSSHYNLSFRDEVDLTLRIGNDTRKKRGVREAWHEKNSPFFPHYVIALEESIDRDDCKIISALSYATAVSGPRQDYGVKTDISRTTVSNSNISGGRTFEEDLFNIGCREPNSGISSYETSSKKTLFASNESVEFDFDLNKAESVNSFDLNDPADTSTPSPCSFSNKLKGIFFNEASCSYAASCEKVNSDYLNEPSVITLEKNVSKEDLADVCDVEIIVTHKQNGSVLQHCKNKTCVEDLNSNMIFSATRSVEQMNTDLVEGNTLVEKAAELLLHLSLGSSVSNGDDSVNAGSNLIEKEESDRPQCSLDSYESLVLKLEETSIEYCVSSKPFKVDESDRKECGAMWKRGRRLKDFQKDILPNVVSLSRHEIREDVGIMEAVMRSREYKRMRSKAADGKKWFMPTNCKRSKRRRRYS